jgi:hypothetical protein
MAKKAARRRERKWRGIIRDASALDHIRREPLALRSMWGMGTLDVAEQVEPKPN